ncbi:hypothetical protein ATPR_1645 [Acetobacter tropicalis NBRC 101654]|uniref:Uncharacterized protein n=1 Tax=Acetobacter tropicalis NBRC 101654 TaxID=749388 RepID=F7VE46_9PROT|nr:hypothetical protein ATPR_1645 [Acetobacter tropicalis NBRC 101654]
MLSLFFSFDTKASLPFIIELFVFMVGGINQALVIYLVF